MSKFVANGNIRDVVRAGSLMEVLYCRYNPASEAMYDQLRDGSCIQLKNGVISYYGVHVFSKCNNAKCETCAKYKIQNDCDRDKAVYFTF